MPILRINTWHPEKAWASGTIPRRTLFKRMERVSTLRSTALKKAAERLCHRESLDVPLRDDAEAYALISFLAGYGAEVEMLGDEERPLNPLVQRTPGSRSVSKRASVARRR
jgi:hypothetical protein